MSFENWDEIRTAYQVARIGTVSGAAEVLGVHHATVIRHIDALEARLGAKLFHRHARGYAATEAGQELFKVAQTTDDKFSQLAARIAGAGSQIDGELVVTSLPGLSPLVTPTLIQLGRDHPDLKLRYLTDARVFRLEYGEAHVAIRAGDRPQDPDYVVQALTNHRVALYASRDYIRAHGHPQTEADLAGHRFVGPESTGSRAPFNRWLASAIGPDQVMFRSNDLDAIADAILGGAGIGFLPVIGSKDRADLVEVMSARPEWDVPLWLVTHVDLHRTPKVQAILAALKQSARLCTAG